MWNRSSVVISGYKMLGKMTHRAFQQAISIHDINFCRPQTNISVTKVSSVLSDGISEQNPKALPKDIVSYCIFVTNTGSATATGVSFADVIPNAQL